MYKKITKIALLSLFIITGLTLYIIFMVNDFTNKNIDNNIYIKYGVVIASLSFSVISFIFVRNIKDTINLSLLVIGLVFTLVSDYFLLVSSTHFEVGVTTFIFAQLSYFLRSIYIYKYNRNEILVYSTCRIVLPIIGLIVLVSINELSLLYLLVVIYFIQLVFNFVETLVRYIKDRKLFTLLLSIGFFLFIGCDICVGLANIGYNICYIICWIFYAPSQILIASHFTLNKIEDEKETKDN